jgi:transposase-like protein
LNYQLWKATHNCFILVGDEAVYKIMYPALRNGAKKWTMPIKGWGATLNQFALFFAGGFRSHEFYLHKTINRIGAVPLPR